MVNYYPTPAIRKRAKIYNEDIKKNTSSSPETENSNAGQLQHNETAAGALPIGAAALSTAARGLLVRLLERDPRVRMRNLRQMQQSAFYMGFNFEHAKAKKVSPKSMVEQHFPDIISELPVDSLRIASEELFPTFSQPALV